MEEAGAHVPTTLLDQPQGSTPAESPGVQDTPASSSSTPQRAAPCSHGLSAQGTYNGLHNLCTAAGILNCPGPHAHQFQFHHSVCMYPRATPLKRSKNIFFGWNHFPSRKRDGAHVKNDKSVDTRPSRLRDGRRKRGAADG